MATDLRTDATTLHRKPERGDHRPEAVHAEALVAHVGFVVDGQPFVVPMTFGRDGDRLYLHGSVANRMLRALDAGVPVCVTFTLLDALDRGAGNLRRRERPRPRGTGPS